MFATQIVKCERNDKLITQKQRRLVTIISVLCHRQSGSAYPVIQINPLSQQSLARLFVMFYENRDQPPLALEYLLLTEHTLIYY